MSREHRFPPQPAPRQFKLREFLGVDFTTHESEVNTRRSPDAVNLISGNTGSMDKRFGTKIFKDFGNKRIWAIKELTTAVYSTEPGNRVYIEIECLVVHAGTELWLYNSYLDTWQPLQTYPSFTNAVLQERETNFIEYNNQNSVTLIQNNWVNSPTELLLLYCIGSTIIGQEGTVETYLLVNDPANKFLYVPTTSIARSPNGQTSTSFENQNILVNMRFNSFLSNGTDTSFILDYIGNIYSIGSGNVLQMQSDGTFSTNLHDASGTAITVTYDTSNHKIVFSAVPHATYITGKDNIIVKFYTGSSTKTVDARINDYKSFSNYGLNGLNNMIFFCNHTITKFRQKEIWLVIKKQDGDDIEQRLYYDPNNYSNLGSNRKMGYSKIGENLILHGTKEGNSPVAYLKNATLDDAGELIVTNKPTTSQIGALSSKAFANLRDDPLFLSEAGISSVLIDRITNVQSIQDRGFYINQQLLNESNLDKAYAFIFDNKYFICVNSKVYIADPRLKYTEKLAYSESFQYDWYYWEGLDIQTHAIIDGQLYFGTTNGLLMKYKNESDSRPYQDEIIGTDSAWLDATSYSKGNIVSYLTKYYICLKPHTSDSVMRNPLNSTYWNEIEKGTGVYYVPVLAYWTTPIMNMGDMTSLKTLKNLWIRLGKYAHMSARIYYSTQGVILEKYDGIFDFSDIDFSRFTFSTDTDPSVLVANRQQRKFNSIQFKVESRDSNPFSLLEIVGEFIFNGKFKG